MSLLTQKEIRNIEEYYLEILGFKVAHALDLTPTELKRYRTVYGEQEAIGLGRTIKAVVDYVAGETERALREAQNKKG